MVNNKIPKIDWRDLLISVKNQFVNLDAKDPSQWPKLPRALILLAIVIAVVVVLWFVVLRGYADTLESVRGTELALREDYVNKLNVAINIEPLKKQSEQLQKYVFQLEKQLPSKAEMDALLSDINQAGLGRSLQFELFRPGQVTAREYYAELPISVRVTGGYHDMGDFAADVAHLSRIVTLNNISITQNPGKDGILLMEATALTFRYLDQNEILEQRKAVSGVKK